MSSIEIWIGLLHVTPRDGNELLEGAPGAFVPILSFAMDEQDFAARASALMTAYGFSVVEIEDVERFEDRREHSLVADELLELAARLDFDNEPTAPGTFHAYQSLD